MLQASMTKDMVLLHSNGKANVIKEQISPDVTGLFLFLFLSDTMKSIVIFSTIMFLQLDGVGVETILDRLIIVYIICNCAYNKIS